MGSESEKEDMYGKDQQKFGKESSEARRKEKREKREEGRFQSNNHLLITFALVTTRVLPR